MPTPHGASNRVILNFMRALIQRVLKAEISVDGHVVGSIGPGLLVFLGVGKGDTPNGADYLLDKILHLRIFSDENSRMNRNLLDVGGALLVASQFTLFANTRKGRRPSFELAAPPDLAKHLYEYFIHQASKSGAFLQAGVFQAHMKISLINDGPVTLLIDTLDNCKSKVDSNR